MVVAEPGGLLEDMRTTDVRFGFQPGGGIDYWFQPHLGLRLGADYRRAFRENRDLNYFRLQAGIVFRFGTR